MIKTCIRNKVKKWFKNELEKYTNKMIQKYKLLDHPKLKKVCFSYGNTMISARPIDFPIEILTFLTWQIFTYKHEISAWRAPALLRVVWGFESSRILFFHWNFYNSGVSGSGCRIQGLHLNSMPAILSPRGVLDDRSQLEVVEGRRTAAGVHNKRTHLSRRRRGAY